MQVVEVDISILKTACYNPRAMTKKEAADLTESLKRFGMVEPLVVNEAEGRLNIVIGGHQRLIIWQSLGHKTVPVHYVNISDIEKEQELNLRLNKNLGHWDYDMLANIDEVLLQDVGWEAKELKIAFGAVTVDPVNIQAPGFLHEYCDVIRKRYTVNSQ